MEIKSKCSEIILLLGYIVLVTSAPLNDEDKPFKDNCKTISFNMPIHEEGCEKIYVRNNYCQGLCHSIMFQSGNSQNTCRICVPNEHFKKVVFLKCKKTGTDGVETMVQVPRVIEIVKKCSCNKCPNIKGNFWK